MYAASYLNSLDPGASRVRRWRVWYTGLGGTVEAFIEKDGRSPSYQEARAALKTTHVTGCEIVK